MNVKMDAEFRTLEAAIKALDPGQVKFGLAYAATKSAQAAKAHLIETLPDYVTVRRPWVARGIRAQAATPSVPTAWVGSRDTVMESLVTGDERTPHKGGGIAIPLVGGPGRSTKTAVMRRAGLVMRRAGQDTFVKKIGGRLGIWQRTGDPEPRQRKRIVKGRLVTGGKVRPKTPISLAFVIKEVAEMRAGAWPLEQLGNDAVRRAWPEIATETIDRILGGRR